MASNGTEIYEIRAFKQGEGRSIRQTEFSLTGAKRILDQGGYDEGIIINAQTSEVVVHRGKSLKRFEKYLNREYRGWRKVESFSSPRETEVSRFDTR